MTNLYLTETVADLAYTVHHPKFPEDVFTVYQKLDDTWAWKGPDGIEQSFVPFDDRDSAYAHLLSYFAQSYAYGMDDQEQYCDCEENDDSYMRYFTSIELHQAAHDGASYHRVVHTFVCPVCQHTEQELGEFVDHAVNGLHSTTLYLKHTK